VPYPLKDGGAAATFSLIKNLEKLGYEVDLFFLNTKKHFVNETIVNKVFGQNVTLANIDTSLSIWGGIKALIQQRSYNLSRFYKYQIAQKLISIVKNKHYDIIHFENLFMAPYLADISRHSNANFVLRMHNVEHQIWEKLAFFEKNILKKLYLAYLSQVLKKEEIILINHFDALLPISLEDQNWVKEFSKSPSYYLPMGFDFNHSPLPEFGMRFFHIGSMEWLPNKNAINWLIEEVWPIVHQKIPSASLHLAGKGMQNDYDKYVHSKENNSQIYIHGEVENAQNFMQKNDILCIPLQAASGLRIKALEAMIIGKPIVSSAIGMSGLKAKDGFNCLIANNAHEFAEKMILLATKKELYLKIANNAFEWVEENYNNQKIYQGLFRFNNQIPKNYAKTQ